QMCVVDTARRAERKADAVDCEPVMAANPLECRGRRPEVHVVLGMHLKPAHRRTILKDLRDVGAAQSDACDRGKRGGGGDRRHENLLSLSWPGDLWNALSLGLGAAAGELAAGAGRHIYPGIALVVGGS